MRERGRERVCCYRVGFRNNGVRSRVRVMVRVRVRVSAVACLVWSRYFVSHSSRHPRPPFYFVGYRALAKELCGTGGIAL